MRCQEVNNQLQLYIDNRLSLRQVRELEEHLARCEACQQQLFWLEEITSALRVLPPVAEPAGMTMLIMQRVVLSSQRQSDNRFSLLRPSLPELLIVVFLASVTTLSIIWQQPSLREVLPFAKPLSQTITYVIHFLYTGDMGAITLVLWVGGAIAGVCITLALAGNEMRSQWFKAMMDRLPIR